MASQRLAHAYLFAGPAGVGKTTTARALFAAVNCTGDASQGPCGQCPSCHHLAGGNHEDLLVLEPPSQAASAQIKVEEVREVIRTLFTYSPFGGGYRMVLIREADHLNPSSANALLKTLEEPPANNILVLTVQEAGDILPTLVSRCRRVNFLPLAEELIAQELEQKGHDPQAARLKAAMSGGSLGLALGLDQDKLAGDLKSLLQAVGAPDDALEDWAFAEKLVGQYRGERIDRQGLAGVLDLLALHFRDAAARAAGRPQAAMLGGGGPGLDIEMCTRAFALIRRTQGLILGNVTPELALTVLLGELRHLG